MEAIISRSSTLNLNRLASTSLGRSKSSAGLTLHKRDYQKSIVLRSSIAKNDTVPSNYQFNPKKAVPPYIVDKKGIDIMNDPLLNKGVGFSFAERDRFEIRGLMPPVHNTIQEQAQRIFRRMEDNPMDDVNKYLFLNSLQDRNETLFYKMLSDNIKALAPIVYTPTVGKVCQKYGYLYRRPRGMYFCPTDRGEMANMVYNWPHKDVDIIVITDGSRILGLGDLGANGMGIPIGKLALYVAAGGIHPSRVLPITFDVGTNNKELLDDPFYLGIKAPRLTGDAYYTLIDELMWAIRNRWPDVLVQFEDFSNENAYNLLSIYRKKQLCFNDDIQGTGAVALAGIYAALRIQGRKPEDMINERVVCVGAGSAGLGVVYSLYDSMVTRGIDQETVAKQFWLVDAGGALTMSRPGLTERQQIFARKNDPNIPEGLPFLEVIKRVKPTILLGLSGVGGIFTEEAIKEMCKHTDRPVIFPLSNPTDRAECSAENAYKWSNGKCIFASGSPFRDVILNGKTYQPSQGNNMFIYPGVGLGAVACSAKLISTRMFARAAEVLSECLSEKELAESKVYPDVSNIRDVSEKIAVEIVKLAIETGMAKKLPEEGETVEEFVKRQMYNPQYAPFILDDLHNK